MRLSRFCRVGFAWFDLHHLLSKNLRWCPPSEAFAWRAVHAVGDGADFRVGHQLEVDFAGQKATEPPVGVFDGTFLMWRLRVAEPRVGTQLGLEVGPGHELAATVEGDRLAG